VELNQATRVRRSGAPAKGAVKGKNRTSVQVSGSSVSKTSASKTKLAPLKLRSDISSGRS